VPGLHGIHQALVHGQRLEDDLVRGQPGLVAAQILRHAGDGFIADPVGGLHHRAKDVAGGHPGQRVAVVVKADNLHLAGLVRAADGGQDGRPVVAVKPDDARQVGMRFHRRRRVLHRHVRLGGVGQGVNDLQVGAGQLALEPLDAVFGVLGVWVADAQDNLAALGQRGLEQDRRLFAGGDIVRADEAGALAGGHVAVHADEQCLGGDLGQERGLLVGVNRADGDAVHAAGDEVVHNLLLFRDGGTGEIAEIQVHVAEVLHGAVAAVPEGLPEIVLRVGDKGQAQLFGPAIAVAGRSAAVVVAARSEAQDAQGQDEGKELFHRFQP